MATRDQELKDLINTIGDQNEHYKQLFKDLGAIHFLDSTKAKPSFRPFTYHVYQLVQRTYSKLQEKGSLDPQNELSKRLFMAAALLVTGAGTSSEAASLSIFRWLEGVDLANLKHVPVFGTISMLRSDREFFTAFHEFVMIDLTWGKDGKPKNVEKGFVLKFMSNGGRLVPFILQNTKQYPGAKKVKFDYHLLVPTLSELIAIQNTLPSKLKKACKEFKQEFVKVLAETPFVTTTSEPSSPIPELPSHVFHIEGGESRQAFKINFLDTYEGLRDLYLANNKPELYHLKLSSSLIRLWEYLMTKVSHKDMAVLQTGRLLKQIGAKGNVLFLEDYFLAKFYIVNERSGPNPRNFSRETLEDLHKRTEIKFMKQIVFEFYPKLEEIKNQSEKKYLKKNMLVQLGFLIKRHPEVAKQMIPGELFNLATQQYQKLKKEPSDAAGSGTQGSGNTSAGSSTHDVQSDKKLGFEKLLSRANEGDREAQYQVANHYFDGTMVNRNIVKALDWYENASELGHENAARTLTYFRDNCAAAYQLSNEIRAADPDTQNKNKL